MRLLFITDQIPYPPVSGNLLRTYHLCRRIARQHEVWLAAPINSLEEMTAVKHMQQFCHRVITAQRRRQSRLQHIPGLVQYAVARRPFDLKFEHCEALFQEIHQLTHNTYFDLVHIEPSYMALYREAIADRSAAKRILTFHNIESQLFERQARITKPSIQRVRIQMRSWMFKRWEPAYAAKFNGCITVSEPDRNLLLASRPDLNVKVIPNGVDIEEYRPLPREELNPSVLFVGSMNYQPCADAAILFCTEVLPRIRQLIGHVDVWLVGRDPSDEVQRLAGDGVHVTGWVPDVRPYYARSSVCVVPLRAGGGTRLKILEAMALGRPVVSTALGCEGLNVKNGKHLFIADAPAEFADRTVQLLTDTALWQRMIAEAHRLVEEQYAWNAITRTLLTFYAEQISNQGAVQAEMTSARQ